MQPEDHRETMPKDWQEGYLAAMNAAASVARELYVNHVFHTGTDGLLHRCQQTEQLFLREAEKMHDLLRHNAQVQRRRSRPLQPMVGLGGTK